MIYIKPLYEYKFNLTAKKLKGLSRLTKLKIPSVPYPFVILPKLYQEYIENKIISDNVQRELKKAFYSIRRQGNTITLRNSIFEHKNPAIQYSVHNTLNIKSYDLFLQKIKQGYKKAIKMAMDPNKVEFCFFFYAFYSSEKCGILLSENGNKQIFLQAILGQHTNLILRGDIVPDEYLINKRTFKIASKKIARKTFRMKKQNTGIVKIRVKKVEQNMPVLSDDQVIKAAKLSRLAEKYFGPQEMEWAMLDNGQIIFQETRDFTQSKRILVDGVQVIYPQETEGEVLNLKTSPISKNLSDKVVITDNLSISFINKLAFMYRPRAVILTRGSITSHAATVLRESKITTLLTKNIDLKDGELIKINKKGHIQKII